MKIKHWCCQGLIVSSARIRRIVDAEIAGTSPRAMTSCVRSGQLHRDRGTARKCGSGYAACEYSLISPLRIFLRRARAEARSATAGSVSVALGGRWSRPWWGLCSL